jgi:CheY-like chemotaxis protein/KaiC/GvpD/RAD55 family RecA-like ATPase
MVGEKKIFIAEDNYQFCELYRMALGAEGYDVQFAHTGKEALDKIPMENPDLVILDVMMPDLDGYEVCRRLREMPEFALTPIIMLTALSTDEDKIKGYHVGADDYITKPFSLKVLRARVQSILERSRTEKGQGKEPEAVQPPAEPQARPEAQLQVPPPPPPPPLEVLSSAPPVQVVSQPTIIREVTVERSKSSIVSSRTLKLDGDPLEQLCGGAVPSGSNILIAGPLGSGKSAFSRLFVSWGLRNQNKCMIVCLDDDPSMVRKELDTRYQVDSARCEEQGQMHFVDAYSWSSGRATPGEKFAISGTLELADLSALINDAADALGQTEQKKEGGGRVIDSISSLFLNFDLPYVQRFMAYLARSGHFAGVTTIFVVEDASCDEQALNNIKYVMDGVVEFRSENQHFFCRVQSMKWAAVDSGWTDITFT